MPRKEQQQKSERISGLEVLMGTDAYRKGIENDLEERATEISRVLEASSVLLNYLSDQIGGGSRPVLISNTLSEAVSEVLRKLAAEDVSSLLRAAKKLATPANISVQAAEVQPDPRLTRAARTVRK
jgi:hypothetical protein